MNDIDFKRWRKAREEGLLRYSFFKGFLAWGVAMFIIMTFMINDAFDSQGNLKWTGVFIEVIVWTIGGFLFGTLTWFLSEIRYKKELGKRRGSAKQILSSNVIH
jgi:hypothetical protein